MSDNARPGPLHFSREVPRDIKQRCHAEVGSAIARGDLSPSPCEVCQDPEAIAHHDDYARPLDVTWLCQPHHAERHRDHGHQASRSGRRSRGSAPARTVSVPLTPDERAEIEAGLSDGETLASLIREAGLCEVRERSRNR